MAASMEATTSALRPSKSIFSSGPGNAAVLPPDHWPFTSETNAPKARGVPRVAQINNLQLCLVRAEVFPVSWARYRQLALVVSRGILLRPDGRPDSRKQWRDARRQVAHVVVSARPP